MTLTALDRRTLRRAIALEEHGELDGICPRGPGQHAHFARLERLGLIRYEGQGVDADDHGREVPLYTITDDGRAALARKDRLNERT